MSWFACQYSDGKYWQGTAEVLARDCRSTGKGLQKYWQGTGEVLARDCRSTGKGLPKYWQGTGKVLARDWRRTDIPNGIYQFTGVISPLTPELNPSSQRYLTRFLLGNLLLEPCI
jgi:hypothetical protein